MHVFDLATAHAAGSRGQDQLLTLACARLLDHLGLPHGCLGEALQGDSECSVAGAGGRDEGRDRRQKNASLGQARETDTAAGVADGLVRAEMVMLMNHDAAKYPIKKPGAKKEKKVR